MPMKQDAYEIQFLTPAFLGGADQSGQWRTPPIKALLRQWWRVAYAAEHGFDVDVAAMRKSEGELFGVAANGSRGESRKSALRLRLSHWGAGTLKKWAPRRAGLLRHPEVKPRNSDRPRPVDPFLYLGFGPLQGNGFGNDADHAIAPGEQAALKMAAPGSHEVQTRLLRRACRMLDLYGTLGGRSRNGWGSFRLTPIDHTEGIDDSPLPVRDWREALALDWPHAIGCDEQGALVWQTAPESEWEPLMKTLAEIKLAVRTQFLFQHGPTSNPELRHWLAYPVMNHRVRSWGNDRLPNSLRFKIRRTEDGQLRAVIFHMPCRPPANPFQPDLHGLESVWGRVHGLLDELCLPKGERQYGTVDSDQNRRETLRPMLDGLSLERAPE